MRPPVEMVLIFIFLMSIGALVSQGLTPAVVEWFPMVLPYSNVVKLIPMAIGLSLAVLLIRRRYPLPDEE